MSDTTKKLNLSALKGTTQNGDSSSIQKTEEKISLGATVSQKKSVQATSTQETANTPVVPQKSDISQKTEEKAGKTQAIPVVSKIKEKSKEVAPKNFISLNSIKTPTVDKKTVEDNLAKKEEGQKEGKSQKLSLNSITKGEEKKKETTQQGDVKKDTTILHTTQEVQSVEKQAEEKSQEKKDTAPIVYKKKSDVDTALVDKETEKLKEQIQKDIEKEEGKEKKDIEIGDDIFDNYVPAYGKESKKKQEEKKKETTRVKGTINKKKRNFIIVAVFLCILGAGGFVLFPHFQDGADIQASVVETNIVKTRQSVNNIIQEENREQNGEDQEGKVAENKEEKSEGEAQKVEEEDVKKDEKKTKVKNYLLDNYYK